MNRDMIVGFLPTKLMGILALADADFGTCADAMWKQFVLRQALMKTMIGNYCYRLRSHGR